MRMSSGPSSRNENPRSASIELHRGDAEIEHDAVDRLVAEFLRDAIERGEAILDQRQPAIGRLDQVGAAATALWSRSMPMTCASAARENRAAVAAGAEGAVDIDAAVADVEAVRARAAPSTGT